MARLKHIQEDYDILSEKIKNKELSSKTKKLLYSEFLKFAKRAKSINPKRYFGELYNPHVMKLCFEHYPNLFNVSILSMIVNEARSDILNQVREGIKATGLLIIKERPEYVKMLLDSSQDSDEDRGQVDACYIIKGFNKTMAEPKI